MDLASRSVTRWKGSSQASASNDLAVEHGSTQDRSPREVAADPSPPTALAAIACAACAAPSLSRQRRQAQLEAAQGRKCAHSRGRAEHDAPSSRGRSCERVRPVLALGPRQSLLAASRPAKHAGRRTVHTDSMRWSGTSGDRDAGYGDEQAERGREKVQLEKAARREEGRARSSLSSSSESGSSARAKRTRTGCRRAKSGPTSTNRAARWPTDRAPLSRPAPIRASRRPHLESRRKRQRCSRS